MSGDFRQKMLAFFRRLRGQSAADQTTGEELRRRLMTLFRRLQKAGFNLGVAELLDALELLDSGWSGDSREQWQTDLRLLWCQNRDEKASFDRVWDDVWRSESPLEKPSLSRDQTASSADKQKAEDAPKQEPTGSVASEAGAEPAILPVQPFAPAMEELRDEITLRFPLTRRAMAYGWRHLRVWRPDGPADLLDVTATIEQATQQGFFLAPIFRRRERNHAHLVLLVDQGGSMVPFHRFIRDLIETAAEQIKPPTEDQVIPRVEVFYFHNSVGDYLHHDPHLTQLILTKDALKSCDHESCILVVSDAGAARGYRRRERIRAAARMLAVLRRRTNALAWLNPMPESRWHGASAEVIAELAPMFQMTPDGFSNAIDALRGVLQVPRSTP